MALTMTKEEREAFLELTFPLREHHLSALTPDAVPWVLTLSSSSKSGS